MDKWDCDTMDKCPYPSSDADVDWHFSRDIQKKREIFQAVYEFDNEPGAFYKKLSSLGITSRHDFMGDIVCDLDDDDDPGSFYKKELKAGICRNDKRDFRSNEYKRRYKISQYEKQIENQLNELTESVDFESEEEFEKKKQLIKEYHFSEELRKIEEIKKESEQEWKACEIRGKVDGATASSMLASINFEEQNKKDIRELEKIAKSNQRISDILSIFIGLICLCGLIFAGIAFLVYFPVFTCVSLVIIVLICMAGSEGGSSGYSKPDYIGVIGIWKNE